jgi:hypothetical protein
MLNSLLVQTVSHSEKNGVRHLSADGLDAIGAHSWVRRSLDIAMEGAQTGKCTNIRRLFSLFGFRFHMGRGGYDPRDEFP